MEPRLTPFSTEPLRRLLDDLRSLPDAPVGDHLTSRQFAEYSLGLVSDDVVATIDLHLASCEECNDKMIRIFEQKAAGLRQDILEGPITPGYPAGAVIMPQFGIPPGVAAHKVEKQSWDGYDDEKHYVGWYGTTDTDGNVTLFVSSGKHRDGSIVYLEAGTWKGEVELKSIPYDPGSVEGELHISRDERTGAGNDPLRVVDVKPPA